ncbi:S8 family serine peptidase [Streptomyces sp. NBC_00094]|uniref:S8 family serine peptidase n=1 Tax=Streptomyces sp. NBC_00094 TaxID=2903620 RepID=UPI002255FCAB|nr:S8 family serine peptidase [Streptomyces sp. NBC_00094]MCX5389756.1 S8 family serine peptidase [Streptomyces sp. NBC_00094]
MHLPRSPLRAPLRAPIRRGTTAWATAAATLTALLVAPAVAAAPSTAPAASPQAPRAAVDPGVTAAVQAGGEATFFVVLADRADLSPARAQRGHEKKARTTFDALRTEATRSQASLTAFLDRAKVGYEAYWIANAVKVTGDKALVAKLAARPDVASLRQERHYALDTVEQASVSTEEAVTPEWGVQDIGADEVWSRYDNRGEGIVVANIDSGVQYDHPALKGNYRGNLGDGTFSHDYNWYDPTGQCTAGAPCDNNGHGTHTMGTIAGAGGIGVAPGTTWIAAKGCEARSCSDSSLLKSGQWILAPTDHNGENPRPDLAPDIVNNSWGGGNTTFYQDIIESWNAAGIFEAFAAGNAGNGTSCSTTEAPGAQAPAYGVGAYDVDGKIADFSGFGPSLVDGSMKPNISAPGVNVRSAWPGNAFRAISGTSMATPHVAGAVALLWSSAPSLIGDIDGTRAALNGSARDVDDTHCGGTAAANNVWGEGKLDILAAVDRAPHTAATVTGTVTDRATGSPLAGITVTATAGEARRSVTTDASGAYRLTLAAGTYSLTVGGYGYRDLVEDALTVTTGQALAHDLGLDAVPAHAVTGTVLDVTGKPLKGATVRFTDAPLAPVVTDAAGAFRFPAVAEGAFTLTATPAEPVLCNGVYSTPLAVDAAETVTAALPARTDAAGNSCLPAAYAWTSASTKLALSGDENAKTIALPFPVSFYGVTYSQASVTTNGLVNFLAPRLGDYANTALPSPGQPNGILAAYWDDLTLDSKSAVKTSTSGITGQRKFAIVWENAAFAADTAKRVTFEAVFEEATGAIVLQYQSIGANALEAGGSATVGIENQAGTDALQYSFGQSVLMDRSAIRIFPKAA